jgi:hypothetical protein
MTYHSRRKAQRQIISIALTMASVIPATYNLHTLLPFLLLIKMRGAPSPLCIIPLSSLPLHIVTFFFCLLYGQCKAYTLIAFPKRSSFRLTQTIIHFTTNV